MPLNLSPLFIWYKYDECFLPSFVFSNTFEIQYDWLLAESLPYTKTGKFLNIPTLFATLINENLGYSVIIYLELVNVVCKFS